MFGFSKKIAPTVCPTNPGTSEGGRVDFARGDKKWTEEFSLIDLAASVLKERGGSIRTEKTWLLDVASEFALMPKLVSLRLLEKGGIQSITTIQVNHPVLAPDGLFEYQHSTGDTIADSIRKGIDQWAQVDFVPLLEALQANPASCTTLQMSFPEEEGKPARTRRAVLGPVMHFMQKPPLGKTHRESGEEMEPNEHPFCPCCLLTNSFPAFKELIEGDRFCGLRLFAARGEDGAPQADCRVNGDDWEPGAQALREYVKRWPHTGYEFRKQYVVLQNFEKSVERR